MPVGLSPAGLQQ